MIYESISELIGNTPLLLTKRYNEKNDLKSNILCKLEYLNPAGSAKDRPALNMINMAEKEGLIKNTDTAYRGYWCIEAAALVKALELDDTELRDCKYYPYDMAHFC